MSREAVVVSTARTPIGRAFRGALNNIKSPSLLAHALSHAVARAGIEGGQVDDVIVGTVLSSGTAAMNVARMGSLAAGLGVGVPGQTVDRQCASGLMAIAMAAHEIVQEGASVTIGAGQENVSALQKSHLEGAFSALDDAVTARAPAAYMPMLETAEIVAKRYGISREQQDLYAYESQKRTAAAQTLGRFNDEIVPIDTVMKLVDRESGAVTFRDVHLSRDEGNRADTTLESLAALKTILPDGMVTAGNSSQLSDGASAAVLMEARFAEQRGLQPLGIYRGMAVAGCEPDEMGIGPVLAVPRLLARHGLKVDDIGLWEINEAFASQVLYCRDKLGIDPDRFNVDGGGISIGHPYGMTGSRVVGHALIEGKRRGVRYVVTGMCIGGGMGAAALFEIA